MATISLWENFTLAPTAQSNDVVADACIIVKNDTILWLGARNALPEEYRVQADTVHDLQGAWVTPGLIDCHTHLVFGGNRAEEFALRLDGASYEEIARRGGGILSTVRATREESEDELYSTAARRVDAFIEEGVTAIEIKSGYGLDMENERKSLRVARRLAQDKPISVSTTFLGAHALPPEYEGRPDEYIDVVCEQMLPALAAEGLIDAVDVFCERIAFSVEQSERVFKSAQALGLPVKMHAEQLSLSGGAKLAAQYQALSADHLEYLDEEGAIAMQKSGTVAVLLPGAFYFLRETKKPPVALLRKHQVPMAISTDCNPGTSPSTSLLLMLNMASTFFGLSVDEGLRAVTAHAAQALGHPDITGRLAQGEKADFAVWDIGHLSELVYWIGLPRCLKTVYRGEIAFSRL